MSGKPMTYAGSGVDYGTLDEFKRLAQEAAAELSSCAFLAEEQAQFRGESAYVFQETRNDTKIAFVEEGLGTKNRIADKMYSLTGKSYYDQVAWCTVAMIVNDLITVGALPVVVNMHLAMGSNDWIKDRKRYTDLIQGWQDACREANCAWGGGETPVLKGIVNPETVLLSGSGVGLFQRHVDPILSQNIEAGDHIILIPSSGIHANGLTLARQIAEERLKDGYLTVVPNSGNRRFGQVLLDTTRLYVDVIETCQDEDIDIHYAINITGHGWRKLMRAREAFTYVIKLLPPRLPIFDFIQEHGPVAEEEMYANYNMGAGFAIIVSEDDVERVLDNVEGAIDAGHVEAGDKKVVIEPKNITFAADTLAIR